MTITSSQIDADMSTLNNIRLWNPSDDISLETVMRRQSIGSYYDFRSLRSTATTSTAS